MEVAISVVVVGVFIAVMLLGIHAQERQRVEVWQRIADRLRLGCDGQTIHGVIDDVTVRVWCETRGSGKSKHTVTIIAASLDGELPLGIDIVEEGILYKIGKVGGMQDIQLDLPGLDAKLMVRAADEAEVRAWAQRSDVSRGLVELADIADTSFAIKPHEVRLEAAGGLSDASRLEDYLERIVRIARALSGRGYGALIDDGKW